MTRRRAWPFRGDSPVVRARKAALAYRQTALDLDAERRRLADLIARIEPRVVEWICAATPQFEEPYRAVTGDAYLKAEPVADLDRRLYEWGEEWHAEIRREAYDDDEMITGEEAAQLLGVAGNTVNRHRTRGRLAGEWIKQDGDATGRFYYRAGDVYRLSSDARSRKGESTVIVPDKGTGDPA